MLPLCYAALFQPDFKRVSIPKSFAATYFSHDFAAVLDAVFRDDDVLVRLQVFWRRVDGQLGQEQLLQGSLPSK